MTERDIRGNSLAILGVLRQHVAADLSGERRAEAEVMFDAAGGLIVQVLVDVNRIANALEQIALNGHPRAV